ncbi:MAG: CopD family protein [Polyangiales bacterium]
MLVFRYIHFLGVAFWLGSVISIAIVAATPTQSDSGVAAALRRAALRVATPAMLLAFIGGFGMLIPNFTTMYAKAGWMHAKLTLVILLAGATGMLTGKLRRWGAGQDVEPKSFSRLAAVMGVLGVLIVTFAVLKPFG